MCIAVTIEKCIESLPEEIKLILLIGLVQRERCDWCICECTFWVRLQLIKWHDQVRNSIINTILSRTCQK